MATNYPGAIDSFTNPRPSDALSAASALHTSQHGNANDAITAIENALGTYPGGGFGSVVLRFQANETATGDLQTQITSTKSATAGLQTQVSSLWNAKVSYVSPSASVNFGTYSLTAASLSALSITSAGTVSAQAVSAGNVRTATLTFDDGTTQITAGGGGGGGGIPYTGATANVNLGAYSLTATSISSQSITSKGTVSALTVSAGQVRTAIIRFDDGTSQSTAGGAISGSNLGSGGAVFKAMSSTTSQFRSIVGGANIGVTVGTNDITLSADVAAGAGIPYNGATANLTLGTYSMSAATISSNSVCAYSLWARGSSGRTLRMGQFSDSTPTATYDFWFNDAGVINWLALRSARARVDWNIERSDSLNAPVTSFRFFQDYLYSFFSIYNQDGTSERIRFSGDDNGSFIAGSLSAGVIYSPAITAQMLSAIVTYQSVSTLQDAINIATNAASGNFFRVTLSNNRILANPTNGVDGQKITWAIRQPSTGGAWTIGFDTKFRFGTSITGMTSSTGASKTDYIGAVYSATDDKWDIIAVAEGY